MKNILRTLFVLLYLLYSTSLISISMVYNFRIAEITRRHHAQKTADKAATVMSLIFDQYRKKYNGVEQNFLGVLASYIYDPKPFFFRLDGAVSNIKERTDHITTFSGTETDDILLTFGRHFTINKKTETAVSGFFGIPTHKILRLRHVDFGYSQYGTGFQLDGSYAFNRRNSFLYGTRYLYFIPKTAHNSTGKRYKFTIGNVADFLFAYKNRVSNHGIELGYTTRFRFGCDVYPTIEDLVKKTNYIRSNFYGVYSYRFSLKNILNKLLLNISYGFDHVPKFYGNKYIITVWGAWSVSF